MGKPNMPADLFASLERQANHLIQGYQCGSRCDAPYAVRMKRELVELGNNYPDYAPELIKRATAYREFRLAAHLTNSFAKTDAKA